MNLLKIAAIAAVLALGWYGWNHLPGLRTKVKGAVEDYGGWTEEARRADPVGFITFAEKELAEDLTQFRASRQKLAEAKTNGEAQKDHNVELAQLAEQLAAEFRAAYQVAEGEGTWPVQVRNEEYDRDEVVEQVDKILAEKSSYEKVIAIYQEVVDTTLTRDKQLRDRIQTSEATLAELAAKKELVKVDKLTAEADELMAQVEELLGGNQQTLDNLDGPVRSVEELLTSAQETKVEPSDSKADALAFLNGN